MKVTGISAYYSRPSLQPKNQVNFGSLVGKNSEGKSPEAELTELYDKNRILDNYKTSDLPRLKRSDAVLLGYFPESDNGDKKNKLRARFHIRHIERVTKEIGLKKLEEYKELYNANVTRFDLFNEKGSRAGMYYSGTASVYADALEEGIVPEEFPEYYHKAKVEEYGKIFTKWLENDALDNPLTVDNITSIAAAARFVDDRMSDDAKTSREFMDYEKEINRLKSLSPSPASGLDTDLASKLFQ